MMEHQRKSFLTVEDVMGILGVSQSRAYKVIRDLNAELKKERPGTIIIRGRVSRRFFNEKFYDYVED